MTYVTSRDIVHKLKPTVVLICLLHSWIIHTLLVLDVKTEEDRLNIELIVIPYGDNQSVDPNLWNSSFFSVSLFGTEESLDKNIKNLTILL